MKDPKILYAVVGAFGGTLIQCLSTAPFYVHAFKWMPFGWIYQLIVGLLMFAVGLFASNISSEGMHSFPKLVYRVSGTSLAVSGVFVITNINRYAEIFAKVGIWPVFMIGVWVTIISCMALGHSLTTYEPLQAR